ncbi:MAG: alpha/beta hydrolase fold-containing protein [Nevskia sp.]|nr:alpha/beta hydrolase fold-containing protein [Nevskia sp.]
MTMLDPNAAKVLAAMAGQPTLDMMTPPQARAMFSTAFPTMQAAKPAVAEVRDLAAEGTQGSIPLRLYRPAGSQAAAMLPGIVFFHGGGWVIGDLETYDNICRLLCNAAGCAVVSVDYRLAPEHKFPAAAVDAFDALRWVAAHAAGLGIDAARLAVAGDSAGGNLAAVVSLMARDAGGPALKHQLLFYPVTDLSGETESYRVNGSDYFLTQTLMRWFGDHYVNDVGDRIDWRASPLLAHKHGELPSATVLVCGFDPLRDEGVAYAAVLQGAGVPTQLIRADSQIHGYLLMDAAIPEVAQMIKDCSASLRRALF